MGREQVRDYQVEALLLRLVDLHLVEGFDVVLGLLELLDHDENHDRNLEGDVIERERVAESVEEEVQDHLRDSENRDIKEVEDPTMFKKCGIRREWVR